MIVLEVAAATSIWTRQIDIDIYINIDVDTTYSGVTWLTAPSQTRTEPVKTLLSYIQL